MPRKTPYTHALLRSVELLCRRIRAAERSATLSTQTAQRLQRQLATLRRSLA